MLRDDLEVYILKYEWGLYLCRGVGLGGGGEEKREIVNFLCFYTLFNVFIIITYLDVV